MFGGPPQKADMLYTPELRMLFRIMYVYTCTCILLHVLQMFFEFYIYVCMFNNYLMKQMIFFVIHVLHVCVKRKECLYKLPMKIETASNNY